MANTVLTRTPASTGNRKTFTLSFWVKRTSITSGNKCPFAIGNSASSLNDADWFTLMFHGSTNTLRLVQYNNQVFNTNRVFRDTNGWMHIVIAVDTTQGTASDRLKLYVNGVQETSFSTVNYPSQNYDFAVNNTVTHSIGREDENGSVYFDGLLSHYHFIDGTAYDASAFGETDATTGIWKIKTSPSVTYGTNGFFILKDGNSVTDQSGNGNNWTVAGGTLTNTEDCPSNVFATFNPLAYENAGGSTLSNGNTRMDGGSSAANNMSIGTLAFSEGKYYAEFDCDAYGGVNPAVGIVSYNNNNAFGNYVGQLSKAYGYTGAGAIYNNNAEVTATGTSYTSGDIIGVAVDCDNNKIYWYKNGTLVNSGGTTIASDEVYTFGVSQYSNTGHWLANFGNGYFGTTAVASAGTNASGNGIFEYDVPTGYTALSTKGLNL